MEKMQTYKPSISRLRIQAIANLNGRAALAVADGGDRAPTVFASDEMVRLADQPVVSYAQRPFWLG